MQFDCKYSKDFTIMTFKTYIITIFIFTAAVCHAGPARPGVMTFSQPDGSSFAARVRGDEFMKIITTASGNAIVKNDDGWWCYATYDSNGQKIDSGYRVGENTPMHIINASSMIPYEMLSQRAAEKRRAAGQMGSRPILSRMQSQKTSPDAETEPVTKHGIVILAEYSDISFKHTRQEFIDMLTQQGYSVGGATGCAKEYFDNQFKGIFNFEFMVSEIVTLNGPRAYYGGNTYSGDDKKPAEMIVEACKLADPDVDFSLYDDDNDGYVDNVFVFYAGEDEADDPDKNANCIWAHAWFITSGAGLNELVLDGMIIDQYACASELMPGDAMSGIGTFCHEFSHTLDLPDLYDTDYDTGGWAPGMWGSTSLMDGGNMNNNSNTPPYYNAIEREIMGLSEPIVLEHNGTVTLEPIHEAGKYYRLETDKPNEYYLFECRSNDGWDRYIGGSGLLVYHIDKSSPRTWELNNVNVRPSHQNADLVEADGRTNSLTDKNYWSLMDNVSGIFFPYDKTNSLTADSDPGLKFWSGKKCEISITNIKREGKNITFSVSGFGGEAPPVPVHLKATAFMDAAIITFESDRPYGGDATIIWEKSGGDSNTITVCPYEDGKYSVTLENLEPGNKTYSLSVFFENDGIAGEKRSLSFMTSRVSPVEWPYIYMGKIQFNEDGTLTSGTRIALRVYNAGDAEQVVWSFNGSPIESEGDGFYTVSESGTYTAYVYWEDGSIDVLEKKINVSAGE